MEIRRVEAGHLGLPKGEAGGRWLYALLAEYIEVEGFHCESYGVEVTDRLTGESRRVRHVTTDPRRALELLAALERCGVTPVTLKDVVEDRLGSL